MPTGTTAAVGRPRVGSQMAKNYGKISSPTIATSDGPRLAGDIANVISSAAAMPAAVPLALVHILGANAS